MRTLLFAALALLNLWPAAAGNPDDQASCEMKKTRGVSYRSATSRDLMEVAITAGPCIDAKLTIMIKSDKGRVLYAYENPFEQHVVRSDEDPLQVEATRFTDQLIVEGLTSTDTLPPWKPDEEYMMENQASILIPRAQYERLRRYPQPMISHPTYHEGWESSIYDAKTGASVTVISGGT
jgi:hypothetical protein